MFRIIIFSVPAASFFYCAWILKFFKFSSAFSHERWENWVSHLKFTEIVDFLLRAELSPLGRLLHVLSIRNSNEAALAVKDRSAHLNIRIYLFYAACYGFPPSYASRKQNNIWNVIHWVDNPLWICGRCASLSAYPRQPLLLVFAQDECREFRDLFKRGKLSCTRENDPVRDASGKQHSNKCIMCAEKLWVKERSVGSLFSLEHPGIHFLISLLFQQKGEWEEAI